MGGQAAAIWEEQPDMDQKKYVAYVGTYTHGNSKGIYNRSTIRLISKSLIMANTFIPSRMKASGPLGFFRTGIWNR